MTIFTATENGAAMLQFLTDSVIPFFKEDILTFLILYTLFYWILYYLRGTKSAWVLFGALFFLGAAGFAANKMDLKNLSFLLSDSTLVGVALIVIFQPELRRLFAQSAGIFVDSKREKDDTRRMIGSIVDAAFEMSRTRTGALIVFERSIGMAAIIRTAIQLDSEVCSPLLQTIFFKNSPLHDCAVVIRKNRIVAARAVLPLAPLTEEHFKLGTRHRAAIGISEETDAIVLVVSEETGNISIAMEGELTRFNTREKLTAQLEKLLLPHKSKEKITVESAETSGEEAGK